MAHPAGAGKTTVGSGPLTLDEAIEWLRKHFRPEAAEGLGVSYSLDLGGPDGGIIGIVIAEGQVRVGRAPDAQADVRLRLSAADYLAVLAGHANADLLYMEGRLEIEGDLALATRLRTLFRPRA